MSSINEERNEDNRFNDDKALVKWHPTQNSCTNDGVRRVYHLDQTEFNHNKSGSASVRGTHRPHLDVLQDYGTINIPESSPQHSEDNSSNFTAPLTNQNDGTERLGSSSYSRRRTSYAPPTPLRSANDRREPFAQQNSCTDTEPLRQTASHRHFRQDSQRFGGFFNIPPNPVYTGPTVRARGAPYRDRSVEVWIFKPNGYGHGCNSTFHCNREDILYHFPGLRREAFGRKLCIFDHIRSDLWRSETPFAVAHIFRGLENYRITGEPFEIFGRPDDMLDRSSDGKRAYHDVSMFFCGVCGILAKDGGLGCSEEILDQIDEFVVGLLEMFEPECSFPELLYRSIVVSYSKVFQPSTAGHMETLRQVWNLVPLEIKAGIWNELVHIKHSATPGAASPQIFFQALQDLSLV